MGTRTRFLVAENVLLWRQAPDDESIPDIALDVFHLKILCNGHYPILTGHPGSRRMNNLLRRQFYWLHNASEYVYVAECESRRRKRPLRKQKRWMQIFPTRAPLEFVAIDIFRTQTKKRQGYHFIFVRKDRCRKLARTKQCVTKSVPIMGTVFLGQGIVRNGISNTILTEDGP